jgi:hypothetical protein
LQEAVALEQQAHALDKERKERVIERKKRLGLPIPGEVLTRQEREARIWAFMWVTSVLESQTRELTYNCRNHKPTESDLEDDDDDIDEDDDDPASWFVDDQDDGRKGQDIVEPDAEEIFATIRVGSGGHYSNFFEPWDPE